MLTVPFTNVSTLKFGHAQAIIERIEKVAEEWDLDTTKLLTLNLSNRILAEAMFTWKPKYRSGFGVVFCDITLSGKAYKNSSFEWVMKCLNHELAHWVCVAHELDLGHGKDFKEICDALGGTY